SHTFYRPRTDNAARQVFQLHPNGWTFAPGHIAKLELLGQSAPFGRPSNGSFTVRVSNLELRLPVLDEPDGDVIKAPAPAVTPPRAPEPIVGAARCHIPPGLRTALPCRPLPTLRRVPLAP